MSAQPRQESDTAAQQPESPALESGKPLTGWSAVYDFIMQCYCWMLIFFIVYVLSVGPLYSSWREAVDMGRRPLLQAVYFPLAGLCSEYESVNTLVEWYVGLWQS